MLTTFSYVYWYLFILFGEVSIQVLCPFLKGLFVFLVLSFVSSLQILDINPLSDISENMFVLSVGCLFTLWMFSFAVKFFFSLMYVVHLFIFFLWFPFPREIYSIKY